MGDLFISNQHGYVKRALHAFEAVAEALERIVTMLETQSGASSKSDTRVEGSQTKVTAGSRYDVLDPQGAHEIGGRQNHTNKNPKI